MKNMFKLFGKIALIAVIGFSFSGCDNGTTDTDNNNSSVTLEGPITIAQPSFPAPASVTNTKSGGAGRNTRFSPVNNASDYFLHGRILLDNDYIIIHFSSINFGYGGNNQLSFVYNISELNDTNHFTETFTITNSTPIIMGVSAVSYKGIESEITWGNTFPD